MNGVIRLLADLRARDADELARLVVARRAPVRGAGSLIDLAEWLLDDGRLRGDLDALGWRELHRLNTGDAAALERARSRGFAIRADGATVLLDEVAAAIASSTAAAEDAAPPPRAGVDPSAEPRSGERAFAVTSLAAELLRGLDAVPRVVRRTRAGDRFGGTDLRRLAADLDEPLELVSAVADWLVAAALAAPADGFWRPTRAGRDLLAATTADRWRPLADRWLDGLSVDDHAALRTDGADAAGPTGLLAESLGMAGPGGLTRAGAAALRDDLDAATAVIAELLPAEVESVYVQPDLSIIAPGPLPASLDAAIREMADLEQRSLASTYRLSSASIARALSAGRTVDELRARLRDSSLTPLPQPVEYLLDDAERTHGLVRVRALDEGGRSGTRVSSADHDLVDRMAVDQDLSALALRHGPAGTLRSTVPVDAVYGALADARYPVALEDADGRERPALRRITAEPAPDAIPEGARAAARAFLADSEHMADDESITWLQRRLELARRAKTPVRVRVAIAGTDPVTLEVVPMSVTASRLRARDDAADVERTLPLDALELLDERDAADAD